MQQQQAFNNPSGYPIQPSGYDTMGNPYWIDPNTGQPTYTPPGSGLGIGNLIQKNSIENFDYELWKEILSVNLDATFFIIQELLKSKMNKNLSSIVLCGSTYANVSSNPALYKENELGNPIAYSASKGGIVSLTRYLSVHLAKKDIRVNCISPHGIENNQSDNFQKKFSELSPISRLSRVEETSYPIIFLLSEASSYITGSNLIVDGGWTSW